MVEDCCCSYETVDSFNEAYYEMTCVNIHITFDYLLDEATNLWGQNLTLMYDRVLKYPGRVTNLYFTFLFVLRAVTKVSINYYLEQAEYVTVNPNKDMQLQWNEVIALTNLLNQLSDYLLLKESWKDNFLLIQN
uniref:Endoplasmic oxidoreductin-2 n=1 Tax=Cajanus cajan TaxID=3821 RepID=A0A151RVA3_CAJCA|nr:Endoplasmic oxidoreductin-2 [Cajanus cajan]